MSEIQYYIIDLETTGLSSKYHEVHEIGIIRAKDRMQLVRQVKCSFPERANYDALRVTGKTINDLKQGYNKFDVIQECDKFFNEDNLTPTYRCIVGHNIWSFDRKFLHAFWTSVAKEFPAYLWLDTMQLAKKYIKERKLEKRSASLESCCELFSIQKFGQAHNAKSDTKQTYLLWKKLVEDEKIDYLPLIKQSEQIKKYGSEDLDGIDLEQDIEY